MSSADAVAPVTVDPSTGAEEAPPTEPSLPSRAPQTEWAVAGIALPAPVRPADGPAWSRARDALELSLPYLPPGVSMGRVNEWAQGPFRAWVEVRMRFTQQAIAAFAEGDAPGPSNTEGRAVAGLLMDDFVARFLGAPIPSEIERDPELRGIYEGALLEQSAPLVRQALEYYEGCERSEPALEWRLFCRDRRAQLARVLDGEQQIRVDELPRLREEARLATVGHPPPGPTECWDAPFAGRPVNPRPSQPIQVGVLGTLSGAVTGASPPPATDPTTIPGDVVLYVSPFDFFDPAPLDAAQRRRLVGAVERKLRALVDGRFTPARTAERTTARWRREMPCRAGIDAFEAVRQAHVEAQVGELEFACSSADLCEVRVSVHPPPARGGEIVATVSGEVGGDPLTTRAWTEAIEAVELFGSGIDVRHRGGGYGDATAFGPWNTEMAELKAALQTCAVDESIELAVLYRLDARGRARITTSPAELPTCLSEAVRAQSFEPGEERAVTYVIRLEPEPVPREQAYGARVQGDVHARVSGLDPDPALNAALAQCQLDHGSAEGAVGVHGTVRFAADGTGESAALQSLAGSPEYAECVRRALVAVVDSCDAHEVPVVVCTYREPTD